VAKVLSDWVSRSEFTWRLWAKEVPRLASINAEIRRRYFIEKRSESVRNMQKKVLRAKDFQFI
jgi:hypothetical protein